MPSTPRAETSRVARTAPLAGWGAVLVALVLTARFGTCHDLYKHPASRGAGATTPHYGGTFRFAFDSDVRTLDPHIAYDEYSAVGVRLLFDTLVDYEPGTATFAPSLAERWDITEAGHVYTFHLRHDVRFHNGRLLVADDVRRSFERMLDPQQIPCPATGFYHLIEGFDDFQEHRAAHVRGLLVLDPYTVQFRLVEADQTFLNAMAMPFAAPVPMEAVQSAGRDAYAQAPVGTGPFVLERWEMGSRLVFRRNPHYWRPDRPYLDRIVVETSIARHLQFMRFLRGELENVATTSMSTVDHVWIHQQAAWRPYILEGPDASMYGVAMNTEIPPWNNVHLRRAVAYAIDRVAMCRTRNDRIRPLGGLYPPGLPGYDPNLPGAQHYDVAAAHREMNAAGFPHGLPDETDFWVTEGESGLLYAELIQADLREIGIRVRIRQASFAVFLENTERRGAVPMSLSAWNQDFPDPSNFIDVLFSTRSIQAENSMNAAFYSNPRLDALLDRARNELDRPRRIGMYQTAEQMLVADAPWAFLYYPIRTEVNQPYVRGYQLSPVFQHDFRDTWLDLPLQRFARHERSVRDAWSGLVALARPWRSL